MKDSGEIYKEPNEGVFELESELVPEIEKSDLDVIEWGQTKIGTKWDSHKLIFVGEDEIKLVGTFVSHFFCLVWIIVGIANLVLVLSSLSTNGISFKQIISSLFFIGLGFYCFKSIASPTRISKSYKSFKKGRFSFLTGSFNSIKAVQFSVGETNLVLKKLMNNNRINLATHNGNKSAYNDAKYIADFIGVPLIEWSKHINK